MRTSAWLVAAVLLASVTTSVAQTNQQPGGKKVSNWGYQAEGPDPELPPAKPGEKFDPRDCSGAWEADHSSTRGFRSMTEEKDIPPRTAWAQEVYLSRKTARPHEGKEAVEPAFGNDPIMQCNPKGLLRLFMYTEPAEFIHTKTGDRILMIFQSQGSPRTIWMDGRALPVNPEPRWNGYSVGRWEGDTLVAETTNFTNKTRFRGSSENMKVIERFRRTDANTILYNFTIVDPDTWATPWTGEYPWVHSTDHIYEYWCHEGNYAMGDIMRGARLLEAEEASAKQGSGVQR